MSIKKTVCPITLATFRGKARPVSVAINGNVNAAMPKEFSTGSIGWFTNGKTVIEVDGVMVPCQINVTITAIGSKEMPKEGQVAA